MHLKYSPRKSEPASTQSAKEKKKERLLFLVFRKNQTRSVNRNSFPSARHLDSATAAVGRDVRLSGQHVENAMMLPALGASPTGGRYASRGQQGGITQRSLVNARLGTFAEGSVDPRQGPGKERAGPVLRMPLMPAAGSRPVGTFHMRAFTHVALRGPSHSCSHTLKRPPLTLLA